MLSEQSKEIEKNNGMGILEIASRKLEIPRNASCMTGHNTGQKWQGCKKSKRDQPRIQRRNIQKIFFFFLFLNFT